ncbi:hypothetical protein FN846DRAFT_889758 [Sphaerosporella brunnea]|uniref:Uncharacterized protein n=1 Tax=Sphaerosporella brunnea TaxID=1250544 RepID=A0A5J5EYP9_9PEZI|nr:hypothetical protein FN846DRAFT_889758 [Sphaerosporella brunnea]
MTLFNYSPDVKRHAPRLQSCLAPNTDKPFLAATFATLPRCAMFQAASAGVNRRMPVPILFDHTGTVDTAGCSPTAAVPPTLQLLPNDTGKSEAKKKTAWCELLGLRYEDHLVIANASAGYEQTTNRQCDTCRSLAALSQTRLQPAIQLPTWTKTVANGVSPLAFSLVAEASWSCTSTTHVRVCSYQTRCTTRSKDFARTKAPLRLFYVLTVAPDPVHDRGQQNDSVVDVAQSSVVVQDPARSGGGSRFVPSGCSGSSGSGGSTGEIDTIEARVHILRLREDNTMQLMRHVLSVEGVNFGIMVFDNCVCTFDDGVRVRIGRREQSQTARRLWGTGGAVL